VTAPAAPGRFAPGALVRARGREWVVLPASDDSLLVLRPLGGSDDEVTGLDLAFEGADVEPARFAPPTVADLGDHASARLLHQALRLSVREGAGPFRSFARIAVEPRPYQLVPLLMALRLDPVRLLVADDVGIGKTVEALLVARELLDRGEISRLAVLAPPHLAEQWQAEMREKFHVDPALVLPSTASRLERGLRLGESLFERHPFVVISLDFIKSDRHRLEFLRTAPEFVIVDEAHTCVEAGGVGGGRHQRAELVRRLAADLKRHLVLVTATPHSGNEAAFRALLEYLDPTFSDLPDDLSGAANETARRRLARHMVQRRRVDIRSYLEEDTPFPDRLARDETYTLTKPYEAFVDRVIAYAREVVRDQSIANARRQRVRWWSALALLRSIGSSPAAAAATLRERSRTAEAATGDEADEIGRRSVLDLDDESFEGADVAPGADPTAAGEAPVESTSRRLRDMARAAEALAGKDDAKLARGIAIVADLAAQGPPETRDQVLDHSRERWIHGCGGIADGGFASGGDGGTPSYDGWSLKSTACVAGSRPPRGGRDARSRNSTLRGGRSVVARWLMTSGHRHAAKPLEDPRLRTWMEGIGDAASTRRWRGRTGPVDPRGAPARPSPPASPDERLISWPAPGPVVPETP